MAVPGFVRRGLYVLLKPALQIGLRMLARYQLLGDPWERLSRRIPRTVFGPGSCHDFDWYFEGASSVHTRSLDEVCDWLLDCEYVADADLFHEPDFWQHPRTFERLRKGDCEDHALWAWRQLVEQGIDAEFTTGLVDVTKPDPGGHAWVLFRQAGNEYLLEAVAEQRADMVRPLIEACSEYRPHFSINSRFETY